MKTNSTYNIGLSYDENYERGPEFSGTLPELAEINRGLPAYSFFGKKLNSPLGVPAGPLLNSAYIKLYADLGFDVLTYKTVRTLRFPAHPYPNVLAVATSPEQMMPPGDKPELTSLPDDSSPLEQLSITNSFGMPSREPQIWQEDVAKARATLHEGQMLVVSVVGTVKAGGTLQELAEDFALAGEWAKQAGAEAVEANFSCPNVQSGEGSLYQSPEAVGIIAAALRKRLGSTPLILKMGFLGDANLTREVIAAAVRAGANALAAINTIPANVRTSEGVQALPGNGRLSSGICGAAIKPAGRAMVKRLLETRRALGISSSDLAIVGVGGVMTAPNALEYLELGVDGVQSGTGAMWNPYLAQEFKQLYAKVDSTVSAR
jgi:dihydroorotate dehydrogenase